MRSGRVLGGHRPPRPNPPQGRGGDSNGDNGGSGGGCGVGSASGSVGAAAPWVALSPPGPPRAVLRLSGVGWGVVGWGGVRCSGTWWVGWGGPNCSGCPGPFWARKRIADLEIRSLKLIGFGGSF